MLSIPDQVTTDPATASAGADEAPPGVVHLLGVPIHDISAAELLDRMTAALARRRGGWVLTPNLDILRRLVRSPEYASLCGPATLRVPDGMPLIWASRIRGTALRERVAGSDLIWTVCERAAREGWSVFLLGGNPGAADDAAARLVERYPGLRIAGTECPPLGFERDAAYMQGLREQLCEVEGGGPAVCFVALGAVKQDQVIRGLMPHLPSTWFLGIGISFSFVSGEVRRAPLWARRIGLEWLHRLIQEPRRLGRRYLIEGLPFAARLFAASALERVRGPRISV